MPSGLENTDLPRGTPTMVHQGEWLVSGSPETVLSTVLGSCISACVYDRVARVGGMNHFLLAQAPGSSASRFSETARYGAFAMEALINAVLASGSGKKGNLDFKLFGGGRVSAALSDVGARNIAFMVQFMAEEGYVAASSDLGGEFARKVMFVPHSGRAFVKRVDAQLAGRVAMDELALAARPAARDTEIEMF
ncbi:chemotaxis protein CheD [Devosia enhydra]|uniref:Probable chemoreceptor glutamine deamidase CheD n=1 Tax=Devosia enhydra TaxID=665118 RepID=A0A1K2I091_9HYPH|nr:chemotaxis protein CheD [Devosia enhydra]SFZ85611.1 chemotaxis protein CheD [Devosia enhydra]